MKRRDRRSEKERKAEAAIERRTIQLPEYVHLSCTVFCVIFPTNNVSLKLCGNFINPLLSLTSGPLTVSELAELIDEKPIALIKFLMSDLGIMASMTRSLDPQTINAVIDGYGLIIAGSEDDDEDDDYEYVEISAQYINALHSRWTNPYNLLFLSFLGMTKTVL